MSLTQFKEISRRLTIVKNLENVILISGLTISYYFTP